MRFVLLLLLLLLKIQALAQLEKPLPLSYLKWSATRRLQAGDFQLKVRPRNNLNQSFGDFGFEMNGWVVDLLGKKGSQVVQNVMNRAGSYLIDSANAVSVAIRLRYLQTLWDIDEVAARRLRQELRAGAKRMILIGKPDAFELFRAAHEAVNQRQTQYSDETNYSLFLDKQEAWKKQLANELAELAAFAVPD